MKNLFGLVAFGVLLYWGLQNMKLLGSVLSVVLGLVAPFLLGACIAFIINVPMKWVETHLFSGWGKKKKLTPRMKSMKRVISLVLTLVLVLGIICVVFFLIVPELSASVRILTGSIGRFLTEFKSRYPDFYNEFLSMLPSEEELAKLDWEMIGEKAFSFLKLGAGNLINSTMNIAQQLVSGVVTFSLGLVFSLYVLLQKEQLGQQAKKILYAFAPERAADKLIKVGVLSSRTFSNFLSGQCTEAVVLGLMFFISMTLFRFPYALMISVLIGVTALIPIFGAFIGCVVGAFMILMTDPIKMLWFILLFLLLQQLEGNLIYPKVVGSSVGLPSIWVLVAVTVGGSAMGVLGMLVFIPAASVLYALLRETVYNRIAERKISKNKLA